MFTGNSQPTPPFNIARHRSLCSAQLATGKPVFVKSGGVSRQTVSKPFNFPQENSPPPPTWRRNPRIRGIRLGNLTLTHRSEPIRRERCYYRFVNIVFSLSFEFRMLDRRGKSSLSMYTFSCTRNCTVRALSSSLSVSRTLYCNASNIINAPLNRNVYIYIYISFCSIVSGMLVRKVRGGRNESEKILRFFLFLDLGLGDERCSQVFAGK